MNMKWMSLVAVMTVVSVGCSESEQEPVNKVASDVSASDNITPAASDNVVPVVSDKVDPAAVQFDESKYIELKYGEELPKTDEQKKAIKAALNSMEGISPENLDSEVKGLVAKVSENSDMSEEEATKLEQDLKSVFQKIEAERLAQ